MLNYLTPDRSALLFSFLTVYLIVETGLTIATSSRLCLDMVARLQRGVDNGSVTKCRPICGSLNTDNYNIPFMDRLSPTCQAVMSRYRGTGRRVSATAASPARFANQADQRISPPDGCTQAYQASAATNPVVVETADAANFVMCTVPKAGCTLLRTLLYALMQDTQHGLSFRNSIVHGTPYPTAWHYQSNFDLLDTYPTFVVGRNPYIRLVSGFLDKMVVSNRSHDWVVMGRVNTDLGMPKHSSFTASRESFSDFVHLLQQASHINPHFDTAVNVCYMTYFPYRYKLRIEEMSEWYPCWSQGLRLDGFTHTGWSRSSDGHTSFNTTPRITGGSCWWAPGSTTCDEYMAHTHSDNGTAIVSESWVAGATTHAHDPHDTKAAERWREMYDQTTADIVYQLYKDDFDAFGYERLVL